MAIYQDNIAETIITGNFPLTLSGAVIGYRTFSSGYGANATNIPMVLRKTDGTAWMTFVGSYTHSGTTISYNSLRASSTGSQIQPTTGNWVISVDLLADEAEKIITLPQNIKSENYTLVLSDAGKHIYHPASDNTTRTYTIPANSSVPFPIGTIITIINAINVLTISISSDTMKLANSSSTGSRTLAVNGIATLVKETETSWIISGIGLT